MFESIRYPVLLNVCRYMLPDGERGGEMILLMPTNKGTAIVELDVIIRVLPLNEQLESPPDEHDAPVVVNYPGKVIFI